MINFIGEIPPTFNPRISVLILEEAVSGISNIKYLYMYKIKEYPIAPKLSSSLLLKSCDSKQIALKI
jgi:hypothetical protein